MPVLGTVARDEYDVTLGYAVAPSLILSVGYKHGFQNKLSGQISPGANVDGVLLGASASAPIVNNLSLCGKTLARRPTDLSIYLKYRWKL